MVTVRLLASPGQELRTRDPSRKPQVILDIRFPTRHRFAIVNEQRVALGSAKIDRGGEPSQSPANDYHLGRLGIRRHKHPGKRDGRPAEASRPQ